MTRIFDWAAGKNEIGGDSYRIWLDGQLVPANAHLFRAVAPSESGMEGKGTLSFYDTDEDGNIISEVDEQGVLVGPRTYDVEGHVKWEYAT